MQTIKKSLPAILAVLALIGTGTAQTAPPDLTARGVIAVLKTDEKATPNYKFSYNLGTTGLRGWIHVNRSLDAGRITDGSRQILVTTASKPASPVIEVDDVILGVVAASSGRVPLFDSDARKVFGAALTEAEKKGAGTLRIKRWRNGTTADVNINIATIGEYAPTAPYHCPKSLAIFNGVRDYTVKRLLDDPNYLAGGLGHGPAIHAIALLASVKESDANFAAVQKRLEKYARSLINHLPNDEEWNWGPAYALVFLAEYYLITKDSEVIPTINSLALWLSRSQSFWGTFGHSMSIPYRDGSGRLVSRGYGPVNAVGNVANIGILLARKALLAAKHTIDPKIDTAISRASIFMASHVGKGSMQYGEHSPDPSHGSNGKDAHAAIFLGLQPNRADETEYFSRIAIASWVGVETGHTGQDLGILWAALGAGMGGDLAASAHFRQLLWRFDMHRRTDFSFSHDSDFSDFYDGAFTSDGTYLGETVLHGLKGNSVYLLTFSLPLKRLFITGKQANPEYFLDATKADHAAAAGSYRFRVTTRTIPELFSDIGDYDPLVRQYAAFELGTRKLTSEQLTELRGLLSSDHPSFRMGAATSLGRLQDATALPAIVGLLRDRSPIVNHRAARALSFYSPTVVSPHRDAMLEAFIANAPADPEIIYRHDPLQFMNAELALVLFGSPLQSGGQIADSTIHAPKEKLLYPALRVGLGLPTGAHRTAAMSFIKNRLNQEDLRALYPELATAASFDTPADRMFSSGTRADAITFMAANKMEEGILIALAMLHVDKKGTWGMDGYLDTAINVLASYGADARYTLPTLRRLLDEWEPGWGQRANLLKAIETIENATAESPTNTALSVADSQVVAASQGPTTITLTGSSGRGAFSFVEVTTPVNGALSGTAPIFTYTPKSGFSGQDSFSFRTKDSLTTSDPATVSIIVGLAAGNGIKADYFNKTDPTKPILTRTDSTIDFDWGDEAPVPGVSADAFSVRWSGLLRIPETGTYTFSTLNNDAVRLNINGRIIIEDLNGQATRWTEGTPIKLTAGQLVDLQMFYSKKTGSGVAKLKWTGPSFAGANGSVIGKDWLYDSGGIARNPYAHDQTITMVTGTTTTITLTGSGGSELSYQSDRAPSGLRGKAPNLTYTPPRGFTGTLSFAYRVNNGISNSAAATVTIHVLPAPPTTFTWKNPTSGNWSDSANWTPGPPAAAGLSSYTLGFSNSGIYTATHNLGKGFQLNQLNTAAEVTLAGANGISFVPKGGKLPSLNHDGASNTTFKLPIALQAMTTFGGVTLASIHLESPISGPGGIVKANSGNLHIRNNNAYSGGTIINAGTVTMEDGFDSAFGTGPVTLNGGNLVVGKISNATNPLIVHGGKLMGIGGGGSYWKGPITLNGDLAVQSSAYDTVFLDGDISGPGGLSIANRRTCINGDNSYTGKTTLSEEAIGQFSTRSSLGIGPLEILDSSRAQLDYKGSQTVETLTLDGTPMPPGIYGSSESRARNKNDQFFSGTGTVTVKRAAPTKTSTSSQKR